jgi:hypothetical protein
MAAGTNHVPVELYLRSNEFGPAAEYVDGFIEERIPGNWDHSSWQGAGKAVARKEPIFKSAPNAAAANRGNRKAKRAAFR